MSRLTIVVWCFAFTSIALAQPSTARAPAHRVSLGEVTVEMRGEGEPTRLASDHGGERVLVSFGEVTQRLIRRPLPEPPRAPASGARRWWRRVAGRAHHALRRDDLVGDEGVEEVERVPGPTEVIVRFEQSGERYSLEWSVRDHRHRVRDRQLERRFFASIRCASE